MTENVDTQLKQMSEDLKEIIEHLNETNRTQDTSDPVSSTKMEDLMIKSLHSFLPSYTGMHAVVHIFPSFSTSSPCVLLIFMPVRTYMCIQVFLISPIFLYTSAFRLLPVSRFHIVPF